jgi:hypothetical protein
MIVFFCEDFASIAEHDVLKQLVFVAAPALTSIDPLPRKSEQRSRYKASILNDVLALILVREKVVPLGLARFGGCGYFEES